MRASIFHPYQSDHLGCSVRDISEDGAMVEFPSPKELPNIFWLRFDGEATLRLCTIAWHSERKVGVEVSEQIMERRRVVRWTQARSAWAAPRPLRPMPASDADVPPPVRWSSSLVCLREG
jgi:hypothetical protein